MRDVSIGILSSEEAGISQNIKASYVLPEKYLKLRRIIDLSFLFIVSPLIISLFVIIAVSLFLTKNKGIFYTQYRAGQNGKPFKIYKFKTMKDNDCRKEYFHESNNRITKIGKFLRRHRLDEIPQVWNVLKGDMSIIGPRPEIYELYLFFCNEINNYKLRKLVPQGITGWAQINYPHTTTTEGNTEKLMYDLEYLKLVSLTTDLKIITKTLFIVLRGENKSFL